LRGEKQEILYNLINNFLPLSGVSHIMPPSDEPSSDESEQQEQPIQLISAAIKQAGLKWLPILRRDTDPVDIMFQGLPAEEGSSGPSGKDGAME
jgi:hypothetical protein